MSIARARKAALLASGLLAVVYLVAAPQTLDLSAQTFRSDLWADHGFVIWNPDWYGGHSLPGYSLLLPPLGAVFGPVLLGALSAVAATALFGSIAWRAYGGRAWLGVIWFAVASLAAPFAGRTAFALGLAVGLACVWAIQRGRPALAALAGALAAWASPVAGLFVLIACAAVVLAALAPRMPAIAARALGGTGAGERETLRPAVAATAATATALGLLAIAFPTPGYQPFVLSAWIWVPLGVAALFLLVRPAEDEPAANAVLRWGALVYLVVACAALLIETPLGGNAGRLGATFAGPLLAILLVRAERPYRPRLVLFVLALPLLWWCWTGTVRDVASAADDPAVAESYFDPLLGMLGSEVDDLEPLRVVPTRNRWESVYVAEEWPITGGWLRQLESPDFGFLEQDSIEPGEYRAWLAERGVALVAVSTAEPDRLGRAEAELFESGAFDAELAGTAGEWELYRFEGPGSFVLDGDARLLSLEPDEFELELGPERALLGLGFSPYFEVVSGDACVERADGAGDREITRVIPAEGIDGPQTIRVEAQFSLAGALGRDRDCGAQSGGG